MTQTSPLIFCAVDTSDLEHATHLAKTVGPITKGLKLGLEFIHAFGPAGVEAIKKACPDAELFIDLKFHDIPNTVAKAVQAVCTNFAPAYLNVHAGGGQAMMEAAKKACYLSSNDQTKLLAVTILTSLPEYDISNIWYEDGLTDRVFQMAKLAKDSGLDGVVCSPHEISVLREGFGDDFVLMIPGIRPEGSEANDQQRIMTPQAAMAKGASHLVIGRPITGADDPAKAAQEILYDLKLENAA